MNQILLDAKTLEYYRVVAVASPNGRYTNARTGGRYDLVRRHATETEARAQFLARRRSH